MARWQDRLKDNESRVKELTTSQQNKTTTDPSLPTESSMETVVKSESTSSISSKQPFASVDGSQQSVPSELQKVAFICASIIIVWASCSLSKHPHTVELVNIVTQSVYPSAYRPT